MDLSKIFWDERYKASKTGWEVGTITDPVIEYINQVMDKNIRILVSGCSYAH